VGVSEQDRLNLLIDFVYTERAYSGSSLNQLQPEVFLGFIDRCLTESNGRNPYWRGFEVKDLFARPGLGEQFFNLISQDPEHFERWYSRLYSSSIWIPEDEARQLREKIIAWRRINNIVLDIDQVFSCLSRWEFVGPNTKRLLDWVETYSGDIACSIVRISREPAPEDLEGLAHIYDKDMKESPSGDARPAGVWLPILGDRLLELTIGGQNSVSFPGNLITEVQGVAGRLRLSDKLQSALRGIHEYLHYSRVDPAVDLVRGLYSLYNGEIADFQGVTDKDIKALLANSEARSKLDLIRDQICPEISQDKHLTCLKMAIDLSRAFDTREQTYEGAPLEKLLTEAESILKQGLDIKTIIALSEKITQYNGKKQGELLPVVLALRGYLLDVGITPEGVSSDDLLKCGLNIARYTGEIAPETFFAWSRMSKNHEKKLETEKMLLSSLRLDYRHLSSVQKTLTDYYRTFYYYDDKKAADVYRQLTSRSMVDWLYRLVQEQHLQ
jgi:predicted transcriptional regulator